MAGRLFGIAGQGNSAPPAIAGFKVQTSVYGLPIPIVYGQARVAGNLIHFTDPKATAQLSQGSRSKLVKIDSQVTGYLYQAAVALALAEGPIVGIAKVWRDKDTVDTWTNYAARGWSLFLGTATQSAWTYLTSNHPSEAVPYQLTVYVAHPTLELPNNVLSNYTWEIQGLAQFGSFGIVDANPKDALVDVLTNADHGAGFPSAQLGDLTPWSQYCIAMGLFLSPVFNAQSELKGQLQELVDATNSAFVWSDGKLKVVSYGDTAVTGNGQTFTPALTPLYDLTDDDFIAAPGVDPVTLVRKTPSECFNQLTVEYEDRAHDYNPNVQEAKDDAAIAAAGRVLAAPPLRLSAIKDASTARLVAQLKNQRTVAIRNTYHFTLPIRYALLEPMDLVTLTDAGLQLTLAPVRLTEIVETADDTLECTAEEVPAGVATASRYGAAGAGGFTPATTVAPGATTTPVIFEGPAPRLVSALEIWIAASGGANWGGCDVWMSSDNVTFQKVGSITRKATFGATTATLAAAAASPPNDTTHTLAVDVTTSGGSLVSGSAADLAADLTLCLVENEFLSFQTAALTSAFHYNLTTLRRGLFGSPIPSPHASAVRFARCDDAVYRLAFPQGVDGQVVYFKFPAFNVFGLALEDVAAVASVSHTITKNAVTARAPTAPKVSLSLDVLDSDEITATLTLTVVPGTTAASGLSYTLTHKTGRAAVVTDSSGAVSAMPATFSGTRDIRFATIYKLTVTDPLTGTWSMPLTVPAVRPELDGTGNLVSGPTTLIDLGAKEIVSGLAIGSGVRGASDVAFGATVKYPANRHNEEFLVKHGASPTFGVSFERIPQMRVIPQVWTLFGASSTSDRKIEFRAQDVSVAGFTARCVSSTGSSATAQTDNFASSLNGVPASSQTLITAGAAAYANLSSANGVSTTYVVVYDVDTSTLAVANTLFVEVFKNAGTSSSSWTKVGSMSYTAGQTLTGETISFTATLPANYDVRILISYATAPGIATALVTAKRVDYNVVTAGTETDLTSATDAGVYFQAMENHELARDAR